ncbi:hypothetical protein ASPZODRAFT_223302 [Penicilliopsis zonata CBS 506.65]|uniref:RING-type domain-containing protein n=1 Tax=Penicilliopsis zonata CBS 506.65 TaxID=1073090 RepID=A0A1L9SU79_9EURO|nr:hypothetical protein ASPZODRAFT_223302 [Penicilliopsis zonata CBS 506.65]OJJ50647.1 hypothetical protein ASPZODRAFT_223302 [Penicilliopsis zonata CBS 506.65]
MFISKAILVVDIMLTGDSRLRFYVDRRGPEPEQPAINLPTETRRRRLDKLVEKQPFETWWESLRKEKQLSEEVKSQFVCAICLETIESKDTVYNLACRHAFHTDCLERWYISWHLKCPVCQQVFAPGEDKNAV